MIGRQISHFYIIRMVGSGGMGTVYEAQDTRLPRSVAVKVLKTTMAKDVDAVRRFKREARLASCLNHPNICTVLDVDEGNGQAFIAMELLHGESLKSRLAAGRLGLDEILDIAGQVAEALAVAHGQGIIHRDITPGNVFLTETGLVKLLDFGLAKHFPSIERDAHTTDDLTRPGGVAGTIHYMAPEQFSPDASIDYRCDLFSLGTVLYEMATGTRPFDIFPRNALMSMIQEQPHVPIRKLAPHHPVLFERIVDKLLEKRPDDRYQTARALRADLDSLRPYATATIGGGRDAERGASASVAVLPFEIVGAVDATTLEFRDGLVEDISRRLTAIEHVRVAPRTSIRAAAGQSVREMGKALAVGLVLEGTVQHSDDRVRVTANLVDTAQERSVRPALRAERVFKDLLAAQDGIAQEICDCFATSFLRARGERYTPEPDAYHAFQRGMHQWKSCFAGGWRPAIEHFQYALERDPGFALAHVALANAYNFLGFYCLMKPKPAFGVAARAARRAATIDGTLAAAYRELALAKFGGEWDWEGSEDAFRRALALDASDPLTHVHYSWLLILLDRPDAAFAEAQKAQGLAPSSRLVAAARAQTLYIGGRYDEAIEVCNECLRRDPEYVFALHLRGLCFLASSVQQGAVADLEQAARLSRRAPFYVGLLGRCYGQFGLHAEARALIAELERITDMYVPPQCYVFIHAGLGEQRRALEYQERAYEDGASPFNYLTPSIRDLYALDPYHKERLRQMRLIV